MQRPRPLSRHDAVYKGSDRMDGKGHGDPRACASIMGSLEMESLCFRAACIIIGNLAAIFKQVVLELATGIADWFAALLALTRLGSHLTAIARAVNLVNASEVEISQSSFSNPVT